MEGRRDNRSYLLCYQMRREWVHEGLWLREGVLGVRFLMRQRPPRGMIRVQVGYPRDRQKDCGGVQKEHENRCKADQLRQTSDSIPVSIEYG